MPKDQSLFYKPPYGDDDEDADFAEYAGLTFHEFWDKIGPPQKFGQGQPIFPYEELLLQVATEHKHIWIKKATGLGITEFWLRWIAWMATKNNRWRGKKVCIITGPNEELAIGLISRIKAYFPQLGREKSKQVTINGCKVVAYPANHLDAMRSLTDVIFILNDEADFFRKGERENARHVSERYIAKSNPWIVWVSTPNNPDGLFDHMEHEKESIYERIFLDYTHGIDKIYSREELAIAMKSPSFQREYCLQYGFGTGNVFNPDQIDACIVPYDLKDFTQWGGCREGVDPAYGTGEDNSKFAYVVAALAQYQDPKSKAWRKVIRLYVAAEYQGLTPNKAEEIQKYIQDVYKPEPIRVDNNNPGVIKTFKSLMRERVDYENDKDREASWRVKPISFATDGRAMLTNLQQLVADGYLQIHPSFLALLGQMRSARVDDTGKLDKTDMPLDLLDALRLCVYGYRFEKK